MLFPKIPNRALPKCKRQSKFYFAFQIRTDIRLRVAGSLCEVDPDDVVSELVCNDGTVSAFLYLHPFLRPEGNVILRLRLESPKKNFIVCAVVIYIYLFFRILPGPSPQRQDCFFSTASNLRRMIWVYYLFCLCALIQPFASP